MYQPLPIGVDDFEEIIVKNYYYVDKTLMIKELLDKMGKVNLFTRPRRFGKTLNLSMLKYYFEDTGDAALNRKHAQLRACNCGRRGRIPKGNGAVSGHYADIEICKTELF